MSRQSQSSQPNRPSDIGATASMAGTATAFASADAPAVEAAIGSAAENATTPARIVPDAAHVAEVEEETPKTPDLDQASPTGIAPTDNNDRYNAAYDRDTNAADLSMAERQRRAAKPLKWAAYIGVLMVAIVVPYGIGRTIGLRQTDMLLGVLQRFDPRGIALIAWLSVVVTLGSIGMVIGRPHRRRWRFIAIAAFAVEQFIGGFALLKTNFWYSTYVVYRERAYLANAANLGILAGAVGFAVYAVLFVAILVLIRKDSPLNVLTKGVWVVAVFAVIEVLAILVVLFGGMLTLV